MTDPRGVPVTARLPWGLAAISADPAAAPLLAELPDGRGYGLLSVRDSGGVREVTKPRPGSDDAWEISAATPQGRRAVAGELAAMIAGLARPWRLRITFLPGDTARLLARLLPAVRADPAPAVPRVQLAQGGGRAGLSMSRDITRTLRRSAALVDASGHTELVQVHRDPGDLAALRQPVESAHVGRDRAAGRRCDLDDAVSLAFWRAVWDAHARTGELEVTTLRLAGELAAYVVALRDGRIYRVWDSRMGPGGERFSAGRRLEAALLCRLLAEGRYDGVDWMSTAHAGALILRTGAQPQLWNITAEAGG